MARVIEWWCHDCMATWVGPIARVNYVVTRDCPRCGGKVATGWGRAAKEGFCLEVKEEVEV